MPDGTQLVAALLVGLLGGAHCVGMCGGIVGTLTLGLPPSVRRSVPAMLVYQIGFNLGRIAGYALAGALMGALGAALIGFLPLHVAQRVLYATAGVFMILLGLYLADWWRGLALLERAGDALWRRLEPYRRRLIPIRTRAQTLALGFIWAFIPCGLVYSVLTWAVAAGSPLKGAMLMLAFGIGTLPNLIGMGMLAGAAARFAASVWVKRVAGALVLGFGVYALWQAL